MQAKKDQSPETGPTPIIVEYTDASGKTKRKELEGTNQKFYDGVAKISEDLDKAKRRNDSDRGLQRRPRSLRRDPLLLHTRRRSKAPPRGDARQETGRGLGLDLVLREFWDLKFRAVADLAWSQ